MLDNKLYYVIYKAYYVLCGNEGAQQGAWQIAAKNAPITHAWTCGEVEVPKNFKNKHPIFRLDNNALPSAIVKPPILNRLNIIPRRQQPVRQPVMPQQNTQQPVQPVIQSQKRQQPIMPSSSHAPANQRLRMINPTPNNKPQMVSRKSLPTMQMTRPRTPNQSILDMTTPPAPPSRMVSQGTQTTPSIECRCRVDGFERKEDIKIITKHVEHLSQDLEEVIKRPFY